MFNKLSDIMMAPWERLKDSWVEYSHAIYVLLVIFGLYFQGIQEASEYKTRAVLIALLLYFVVLLLFLGYFVHSYARKARYAEAMRCVHDAVHELRNTTAYLKQCKLKDLSYEYAAFTKHLQGTLDAMSTAFTLVTGTKCRAAVKIMGGQNDQGLHVKTLCRDSNSEKHCKCKDDIEGQEHLISQNTDYNMIMHNGRNYFLHNSLNDDPNYLNSSKQHYKGKLPYAASIVLPIRLVKLVSEGTIKKPRQKVIGFLAIDSSSRKTFTEKYDVQMGATIADAMYPVLDLWSRVHDIHNPGATTKEIETSC